MSTAVQVTWGIALVIMILGPVALGSWFWARYRPNPRAFVLGAAIFLISQLLLRLPLTGWITQQLGASIQQGVPFYLYLTGMAFSAGLFESVGRWAGYRWLFPPRLPYDWTHAVAYGIGHGGFESAVFVGGLSALNFIQGTALANMSPEQMQGQFSGDVLSQALQAREIFSQLAWHEPLLAAVERMATMPFHIAMSLLVVLIFTRGQLRWLFYAILLHGLADLTTVLLNQAFTESPWVVELGVLAWGVAALWYIRRRYIDDTGSRPGLPEEAEA
ncbi:MAG: YhfC family intramembrane metalloprotease [Anaerolineae bacterium]